jgi:hypothetical protein
MRAISATIHWPTACPCSGEAWPAGAASPDMDRHLRRIGAGDQVRGAEQVEKFLPGEPLAPPRYFLFHHVDMSGRPSESNGAQLEKKPRQFGQFLLPCERFHGAIAGFSLPART